MVEWSITTDCKSVGFGLRGFESLSTHNVFSDGFSRRRKHFMDWKEVNCLTSKDLKGGAMPNQKMGPRGGVEEIDERR